MTDKKKYVTEEQASPGGTTVYVIHGGIARELDPRNDLADRSPSGFSWGYHGSGPAQLALAILADARDDEFALDHYQEFKRTVIAAHSDEEPLTITEDDVVAFEVAHGDADG